MSILRVFEKKPKHYEVWSKLAEMVNRDWVDEEANIKHYNSEDKSLAEAIEDFLSKRKEVVKYEVNNIDVFCDVGIDTGVVYAAWIETDGHLYTIDFTWVV